MNFVTMPDYILNSTYQSLRAFGGHHLYYQVHIKTNIKLFVRIDEQSAKFKNNVSNSNK